MADGKFFSTTKKGACRVQEWLLCARAGFNPSESCAALTAPSLAGEIAELREELNTPDKSKVKDAVKKGAQRGLLERTPQQHGSPSPRAPAHAAPVIAAMTVGKDVSVLLADVVKNGQTANLELKKLVYLYLINYAKSQPDLAILAVNTFVKARPGHARAPARRADWRHRTLKMQTR